MWTVVVLSSQRRRTSSSSTPGDRAVLAHATGWCALASGPDHNAGNEKDYRSGSEDSQRAAWYVLRPPMAPAGGGEAPGRDRRCAAAWFEEPPT
jgi:hypothetical protein